MLSPAYKHSVTLLDTLTNKNHYHAVRTAKNMREQQYLSHGWIRVSNATIFIGSFFNGIFLHIFLIRHFD